MEAKNYPVDFVDRTRKLIEKHYDTIKTPKPNETEGLEVTFLLNCLLGLIVAVVENKNSKKIFKNNIDAKFLNKIPSNIKYLGKEKKKDVKTFFETKLTFLSVIKKFLYSHLVKDKANLKQGYSAHKFLKKIRNGIAHQNISPVNGNKKWTGVRIWNENNHGLVDFEIEFTVDELKEFALFIANEFIDCA